MHFATSRNGLVEPSPFQNFYECCNCIIEKFKRNIRLLKAKQCGANFNSVNLWHKEPTTKEIVKEFLNLHCLNDKLEKIVSPNGLGNNAAFLMPDYLFLEKEFLDFYIEKVSRKEIEYDLKLILDKQYLL